MLCFKDSRRFPRYRSGSCAICTGPSSCIIILHEISQSRSLNLFFHGPNTINTTSQFLALCISVTEISWMLLSSSPGSQEGGEPGNEARMLHDYLHNNTLSRRTTTDDRA